MSSVPGQVEDGEPVDGSPLDRSSHSCWWDDWVSTHARGTGADYRLSWTGEDQIHLASWSLLEMHYN